MERLREMVLAESRADALARAEAELANAGGDLVRLYGQVFGAEPPAGYALHLGAHGGDTTLRFARACPGCSIHAVEPSRALLERARAALGATSQVNGRVRFIEGTLPGAPLPRTRYDLVLTDGLLHHLEDPQVLWNAIRRHGMAGAPVLVRDFRRPLTHAHALGYVRDHVSDELPDLQQDLLKSLHAAFEIEEIERQLRGAHLRDFQVRPLGETQVVVWGRLPASAMMGA